MIWKILWHLLHLFQQLGHGHSHGRMHKVNDYQEMSPCRLARVPDLWPYYDPPNHRKNTLLFSQFTGTSLLLQGSCPGSRCFIVLLGFKKHWQSSALYVQAGDFHAVVLTVAWNVRMSFKPSYCFITGVLLASKLAALTRLAALSNASQD